ncbi:MAG: PorT family protein [Bacteroidaceae bacterium]|nr:PorT family protein [Bacteroidaceae bacterium]
MKRLFMTALCMACTAMAAAQGQTQREPSLASRLSEKSVELRIHAGMNVATLVATEDGQRATGGRRIGFNAGIDVGVPLKGNWYFQTGLAFVQKGFKEKDETRVGYSAATVTTKGTPGYLEIPLLVSFRHRLGKAVTVQCSTGPYVACGVCGKLKVKTEGLGLPATEQEADWFGGEDDISTARFRRFDMGWHLGGGLTFRGGLSVGYAFEAGFLNSVRDDTATPLKTRAHMVNVGFRF